MDEKFLCRGKHLKTGEWIKGFYIHGHDTTYCPIGDHPEPKDRHYIAVDRMTDWNLPNRISIYEIDGNTVGKYSTRKDIHGNYICEGDVVIRTYKDDVKTSSVGLIKYHGDCFWTVCDSTCALYTSKMKYEIIGNIHDIKTLGGEEISERLIRE